MNYTAKLIIGVNYVQASHYRRSSLLGTFTLEVVMSRSYRKPVFSDKKDRYWKKQANRTVRRTKDIANGRAYRKVICSYSICEFRYWILNPTDFWKKSITNRCKSFSTKSWIVF